MAAIEVKSAGDTEQTGKLRTTMIQWLPKDGTPEEQLEEVIQYLKANIPKGSTDIIVFPELFLSHEVFKDLKNLDDHGEAFIEKAKKAIIETITSKEGLECGLVLGGLDFSSKCPENIVMELLENGEWISDPKLIGKTPAMEKKIFEKGLPANAAWVYSKEGNLVHTYHKQKLTPNEGTWEGPKKSGYFEYPCPCHGGKCNHTIPMGVVICADLEDPKIVNAVISSNARKPEIIFNPAWTVTPPKEESTSKGQKREYAGKLYSASASSTIIRTDYPADEFGGSTMVVESGNIIFSPTFPYREWIDTNSINITCSPRALILDKADEIEKQCKELETNQSVSALIITLNSEKDVVALSNMLKKNNSISSLKVELGKDFILTEKALSLMGDVLKQNNTIRTLDMSNCKIDAQKAATFLPTLAENKSITSLYLDNNPLAENIELISDLIRNHPILKTLSLINVDFPQEPDVKPILEVLQTQKEKTNLIVEENPTLGPARSNSIKNVHKLSSQVIGDTQLMKFLRNAPDQGLKFLISNIKNIKDSKILNANLNTKNIQGDNFLSLFAKLYPEVFKDYKSTGSLDKDIEQYVRMASSSEKASKDMRECLALINDKILGKETKAEMPAPKVEAGISVPKFGSALAEPKKVSSLLERSKAALAKKEETPSEEESKESPKTTTATSTVSETETPSKGNIRVTLFQSMPKSPKEALEMLSKFTSKETDLIVLPELFTTRLLEKKELRDRLRPVGSEKYKGAVLEQILREELKTLAGEEKNNLLKLVDEYRNLVKKSENDENLLGEADDFILKGYWEYEKRKEDNFRKQIIKILSENKISVAIGGTDYKNYRTQNTVWIYDQEGKLVHKNSKKTRDSFYRDPREQYLDQFQRTATETQRENIGQLEINGKYINVGTIVGTDITFPETRREMVKELRKEEATLVLNPVLYSLAEPKHESEKDHLEWYKKQLHSSKDYVLPFADFASVIRVDHPGPPFAGSSVAVPEGLDKNLIGDSIKRGEFIQTIEVPVKYTKKLERKEEIEEKESEEVVMGIPDAPPTEDIIEAPPAPPMDDIPPPPPMEEIPAPPPMDEISAPFTAPPLVTDKKVGSKQPIQQEKKTKQEKITAPIPGILTIRAIDTRDPKDETKAAKDFNKTYLQQFLNPIVKDAEDATQRGKTLIAVAWDMDGTFNYRQSSDKKEEAELLGGDDAVSLLHQLADNGCMLNIISANPPNSTTSIESYQKDMLKLDERGHSKQKLESIFVQGSRKMDTLGDDKDNVNLPQQGSTEQIRFVDFHNIMLAGYNKGEGMIYLLKKRLEKMPKEERDKLETIQVHFIDDFVRNQYIFPNGFIEQLSAIRELCPNAKFEVECCWLQVPNRPGTESSYQEEFEPYRRNLSDGKQIKIPFESFSSLFSSVLQQAEELESSLKAKTQKKSVPEHKTSVPEHKTSVPTAAIEVKERKVKETVSPTLSFTAHKPKAAEIDIVKEAQKFKAPQSRTGKEFEEFKGKLGLEKDTTVTNIAESRIQIEKNGKKSWGNIRDLYEEQKKRMKPSPQR